jgi:hypothetical protein
VVLLLLPQLVRMWQYSLLQHTCSNAQVIYSTQAAAVVGSAAAAANHSM